MQLSIPIGTPKGTKPGKHSEQHDETPTFLHQVNPGATEREERWNLKNRRNSDPARNTRRRVSVSRLCFQRPRDSIWWRRVTDLQRAVILHWRRKGPDRTVHRQLVLAEIDGSLRARPWWLRREIPASTAGCSTKPFPADVGNAHTAQLF